MTQFPIALENKDLVGLLLLVAGSVVATLAMLIWPRLRVAALFLIAAGTATTGLLDLNVYSAYWYRGTTRGFEFTGLDVLAIGLLFSSLITPKQGYPRWYWPASLGLMLLFLAYCAVTTMMATPVVFSLFELSKLARGLVFFLAAALFVRNERDLAVLALALALVVCFEAALAVRERVLLGVYRAQGTLGHPNSLSMYLCLVAPVLVAAACSDFAAWIRWTCWVAVGSATVAILLTLSRAGLPVFLLVTGGALAVCSSWRPTPGKFVVGVLAVGVLGALVLKSWPLLVERYGQATLQEEYFSPSGETRGYYFRQAGVILDERPFGVGLNNWSYWVSREYGQRLGMRYENYDNITYAPPSDLLPGFRFAAPAHNLGALTAAEVGWVGLGLLSVLWLRWLQMGAVFLFSRRPDAIHRIGVGLCFGIVGVFLQSFTEWTFRQTQIFLTFNVVAGVLAALYAVRKAQAATATEVEMEPVAAWSPAPVPAAFSAADH